MIFLSMDITEKSIVNIFFLYIQHLKKKT